MTRIRGVPKAGVIYLIGITKQVEEIIFPEAQGVTPDIDTKQAKKAFFQNRLSQDGKIPQNQFLTQKIKNQRFLLNFEFLKQKKKTFAALQLPKKKHKKIL